MNWDGGVGQAKCMSGEEREDVGSSHICQDTIPIFLVWTQSQESPWTYRSKETHWRQDGNFFKLTSLVFSGHPTAHSSYLVSSTAHSGLVGDRAVRCNWTPVI